MEFLMLFGVGFSASWLILVVSILIYAIFTGRIKERTVTREAVVYTLAAIAYIVAFLFI